MCLKNSVAPSSHKERRKSEENSSPSSAPAKPVCLTNVDVGSLMVKRAFKTEDEPCVSHGHELRMVKQICRALV